MKKYMKSWSNELRASVSEHWSSLPNPMKLEIKEKQTSDLFIAASLEFFGPPNQVDHTGPNGSLYYKITVNGETLVKFHLRTKKRGVAKKIDINLHGRTTVPGGKNTVEVLYKSSGNRSWELMNYQNQRQLSILAYPRS